MAQPKDKRRKQKKRVARKPKGGAPLPKSVQALLKYLSGSGTGIGGAAPPVAQTAAQQFQQAAPPPPPQPAGIPKPRAPRVKKIAASAAVPSPLQSIVPQAAAQTTIIQVPATAPKQERETESQKEIETLRASAKQQAGEIKSLQLSARQQGAGIVNADFFKDIQQQIQSVERTSLPSFRTSQAPSYMGRTPSYVPSFAPSSVRSSMRGSEAGGEPIYESAKSRATSVTGSQQSVADVLEEEASALGAFTGSQYIQSAANPAIPEKRMGRGRPAKSEEEKKATRAAAAQRRKETKQIQKEQTLSQSLAQLSGLGAAARGGSSGGSVSSGSSRRAVSGRAQQIFSQAQSAGADPSQTIQAMVAGGSAAALPQAGGGLSLGEMSQKRKVKLVLKQKPQ
jgi:hypothetical protein